MGFNFHPSPLHFAEFRHPQSWEPGSSGSDQSHPLCTPTLMNEKCINTYKVTYTRTHTSSPNGAPSLSDRVTVEDSEVAFVNELR